MTRRDFTRVVYEILLLTRDSISTSQLVRHANLNSKLTKRYSDFLLGLDMIRIRPRSDGAQICELTEKGNHMLKLLAEVQREFAFSPPGLNPLRTALPYHQSRIRRIARLGLARPARVGRPESRFLTKMSLFASILSFVVGLGLGYFVP